MDYRSFLLLNAVRMEIWNFLAYNITTGFEEKVIAQLCGDEDKVKCYIDFIKSSPLPEHSGVDRIEVSDYAGEVMAASEFVQMLRFDHIAKFVDALLE